MCDIQQAAATSNAQNKRRVYLLLRKRDDVQAVNWTTGAPSMLVNMLFQH